MNDYEKRKIEECLYTIWDNYKAMTRPILNDIQVIISLCEKEGI